MINVLSYKMFQIGQNSVLTNLLLINFYNFLFNLLKKI